jgi:hypothetical protein
MSGTADALSAVIEGWPLVMLIRGIDPQAQPEVTRPSSASEVIAAFASERVIFLGWAQQIRLSIERS